MSRSFSDDVPKLQGDRRDRLLRFAYRAVGYLGLVSIFGSQLYGFRYDPAAPARNYVFNLLLYGFFIVPHLVMTRGWFKQATWGLAEGSPKERRVYILTSVVTWFVVWFLHWPVPGPAVSWPFPQVVMFFGLLAFLLCLILFFQGITFEMIDGLLGMPGAAGSYTHGAETPLFTTGPYAEVRHPMYRASFLAGVASVVVHPHAAQLFWALLISGTFIAYIPVEEAQLAAARGEEYERYRQQTPFRLFRGIW